MPMLYGATIVQPRMGRPSFRSGWSGEPTNVQMRPVCRVVGRRYRSSSNTAADHVPSPYLHYCLFLAMRSFSERLSLGRTQSVWISNQHSTTSSPPVSQVSRHDSPDAAVCIRTDSLRSITASPMIQIQQQAYHYVVVHKYRPFINHQPPTAPACTFNKLKYMAR